MDASVKMLLEKAKEVLPNAYNQYSGLHVAAALLCEDGVIFTGVNVENASYGGTICAERAAIVKAVSEGHRRFSAIAVISDLDYPIPPCGICRQVLVEFGHYDVYFASHNMSQVELSSTALLLPHTFGPTDMERLRRNTPAK